MRCLTAPATPAFCINTGSPSPPRQPDNSFSCIPSFSVHFQTLCSLAPCVPCTSYLGYVPHGTLTQQIRYTNHSIRTQYFVPQVSTLDLDRQGITLGAVSKAILHRTHKLVTWCRVPSFFFSVVISSTALQGLTEQSLGGGPFDFCIIIVSWSAPLKPTSDAFSRRRLKCMRRNYKLPTQPAGNNPAGRTRSKLPVLDRSHNNSST